MSRREKFLNIVEEDWGAEVPNVFSSGVVHEDCQERVGEALPASFYMCFLGRLARLGDRRAVEMAAKRFRILEFRDAVRGLEPVLAEFVFDDARALCLLVYDRDIFKFGSVYDLAAAHDIAANVITSRDDLESLSVIVKLAMASVVDISDSLKGLALELDQAINILDEKMEWLEIPMALQRVIEAAKADEFHKPEWIWLIDIAEASQPCWWLSALKLRRLGVDLDKLGAIL